MSVDIITLRRPDDWHVHLRDGEMLSVVVPYTAARFARAIVMPNLVPPITIPEAAHAYHDRILSTLPSQSDFQPLMTCYLTDDSNPDTIARGHADGTFIAAKLYPAHATTNARFGVTDVARIGAVLERMEKIGMPLLVHGETADPEADVFDREMVFLEKILAPLLDQFAGLKVVLEHITTAEAVAFVEASKPRLAATITPHHLMINRNAIFAGGIRPHFYCLPVAKRERHRQALRKAATSGASCFFLGTDSAPHPIAAKEAECGCAGIFNAPCALECYVQVFDEEEALDKLETFASVNGPRFYGLPLNQGSFTLHRRRNSVISEVTSETVALRPFLAGNELEWCLGKDVHK